MAVALAAAIAEGIGLVLLHGQNERLQVEMLRIDAQCAQELREARREQADEPFPTLGPEAVVEVSVPGEGAAPVEPTDGGVFALDATEWEVLRADSSALAREVRYVPHKNPDGVVDGFRVAAIRRGSLLARVGFRNGDVVRSVNGRALIDADAALEAWQAARDQSRFTFDITRRNEPLTLVIEVR